MIRHVVFFRFKPAALDVDRARFDAAVRALRDRIPCVAGIVAGPSLRLQAGDYDYVLMLDFADRAAFDAYKAHPEHRRLIEEHIRPCVADSIRAQVGVPSQERG